MNNVARTSIVLTLAGVIAGGSTPLLAQDSTRTERPSSDLITREQIDGVKSANLYDVVEALHSNWLNERMPAPRDRSTMKQDTTGKAQYTADYSGTRSMPGAAGGIQVYFDGTRVGGLAELKSMRPTDVYNVRRINGIDAQARFGIGHSAGVIYVSSVTMRSKSPD
jgi:hypothetical protein